MSEMDNRSLLEFKVDEQGKTLTKVAETMEALVKKNNEMYLKQELSDQKIKIYTIAVGIIFNTALVLGIQFFGSDKGKTYTEEQKKEYYESRVQETEVMKMLKEELTMLRKEHEKGK